MSQLVLLGDAVWLDQLTAVVSLDATYAVILGNPDTGRPMPAEQIKAVAWDDKSSKHVTGTTEKNSP